MSIKFKDPEKNVYIKGLGICKAMLHILVTEAIPGKALPGVRAQAQKTRQCRT